MKKSTHFFILSLLLILGSSCSELTTLDNYDAPDARIFGSVLDEETGEPIPQELINGTVIQYVELGFENPNIQQLKFHTDGTYQNNQMFSGTYAIQPVRGNFYVPESDTITVEGATEHNFEVVPYIRIKDVNIAMDGSKVVATFRVEQVAGENVLSLSMTADVNPNVGQQIFMESTTQNVNAVLDPAAVQTLELGVNNLESGKSYYFRVGALIDVPEAKYNYSLPIAFEVNY